jgi:hypothetical protein
MKFYSSNIGEFIAKIPAFLLAVFSPFISLLPRIDRIEAKIDKMESRIDEIFVLLSKEETTHV